jgi:chitinase
MIQELRALMALELPRKKYLITGAPQCFLKVVNNVIQPEANMGGMIASVAFDALFIQFYNNPSCSANSSDQATIGGTGFNYKTWVHQLASTPNFATKLYLGLPANAIDVSNPSDVLLPLRVKSLVAEYQSDSQFGGVMLWEATGALASIVTPAQVPGIAIPANTTYFQWVKQYCLQPFAPPPPTSTSSTVTSTTTT